MAETGTNDRTRLTSWKDIARHLDRDVRTVMRWEKERGLPVYRVPGGKAGRVWAYADELTAWFVERPVEAPSAVPATVETESGVAPLRSSKRRVVAIVAALALVMVVAVIAWLPSEPIHDIVVDGTELRAIGRSGKPVWTYRIADATSVEVSGSWHHIADLDGDERPEVLVALSIARPNRQIQEGTLFCFTGNGRLKWTHTPEDRWQFGDGEYAAPWKSSTVSVVRLARGVRVAWAVHHHTWWPSMLLLFDDRGNRELAYLNAGYLSDVGTSADGRRLFVAGISNARQSYFLSVLDADRTGVVSPEEPGSSFECRNCPTERPLFYYTFGRTEASRMHPFPGAGPSVYPLERDRLQVWVKEAPGLIGPSTIYEFTGPEFANVRGRYADSYWEWHRDAERRRAIDHSVEQCPERSLLSVSRWSSDGGWTTLRLPADAARDLARTSTGPP